MALTKIEELNSLLDRFLQKSTNTGLNALIPYTYTTQGNLYWIDPHNSSDIHSAPRMRNNNDIEQQFHYVYGPFVSDNYEDQINSMIYEIVKRKDGHFMCSTVKVDTIYWGETLSINIIIIRPCLQKRHIFGKILYELSKQLAENIVLQINNCMPESQRAMEKYYGGSDLSIFDKPEKTDRQPNDYVTYTLLDRAQFQKIYEALGTSLPTATTLNGKETSEEEKEWARFAEANAKTGLANKLVEYQFKKGYGEIDLSGFIDECYEISHILEQEMDEANMSLNEHEQNMTEEEVDDAQAIINEMNILLMKTQDMTNENRKPNAMLFTAPSP